MLSLRLRSAATSARFGGGGGGRKNSQRRKRPRVITPTLPLTVLSSSVASLSSASTRSSSAMLLLLRQQQGGGVVSVVEEVSVSAASSSSSSSCGVAAHAPPPLQSLMETLRRTHQLVPPVPLSSSIDHMNHTVVAATTAPLHNPPFHVLHAPPITNEHVLPILSVAASPPPPPLPPPLLSPIVHTIIDNDYDDDEQSPSESSLSYETNDPPTQSWMAQPVDNKPEEEEEEEPKTMTSHLESASLSSTSSSSGKIEEAEENNNNNHIINHNTTINNAQEMILQLKRALTRTQIHDAIQHYERLEAARHVRDIPMSTLYKLFKRASYEVRSPILVCRILQECVARSHHPDNNNNNDSNNNNDEPTTTVHHQNENQMVGWYRDACYQARFLDPRTHYNHEIQGICRTLLSHIQALHSVPHKITLYRTLVRSLLLQQGSKTDFSARRAFDALIALQPQLDAKFLENLLSHITFNRRRKVPFPFILTELVKHRRPNPEHAIEVLEHLYPFDNQDDVLQVLNVLVELQKSSVAYQQLQMQSQPQSQPQPSSSSTSSTSTLTTPNGRNKKHSRQKYQYIVDQSILELIGASATQTGNLQLSLLVWDAAQAMGYTVASIGMYENLALFFCTKQRYYCSAFTVLTEMEARGLKVSRSLIRAMSYCLCTRTSNMDAALRDLMRLSVNGLRITTAMLNIFLSAGAHNGDIDRALHILDEYQRQDVPLDADSYAFALETLGKHLSYRRNSNAMNNDGTDNNNNNDGNDALHHFCLETATAFLSQMDDQGVAPTHHVIRHYVELLCQTGQLDVATNVILEYLSVECPDDDEGFAPLVGDKSIYRVALEHMRLKNFDMARRLEASSSEPLPVLIHLIEKSEQNALL